MKMKFLLINIVILISSLSLLSIFVPSYIQSQLNRFQNEEKQNKLKEENIEIESLQKKNTKLTLQSIMMHDKKHGTNLSEKILANTNHENHTSPIITQAMLENIRQINIQQIKTNIAPYCLWNNLIKPSLIWIILTCLTWVTNNFLDSFFKKKK